MQRFKYKTYQDKICQGRKHQHDESSGVSQRISWHTIATYSFGYVATKREPEAWLDHEKEEGKMEFTIVEAIAKDVYHID